MGKMKFNLDDLEDSKGGFVVKAGEAIGGISTPIANAVKDTAVSRYMAQKDILNENQHTIQTRLDTVSSIIGDVCGVLNTIANAISQGYIEKQKTKQVEAAANAQVKMAREQTEQVRVQEKEATKRIKAEYLRDIEMKQLELEKFQTEMSKEKYAMDIDERKFNSILAKLEKIIDSIIDKNDQLMNEGINYDMINANNDRLVVLSQHLVELYTKKS